MTYRIDMSSVAKDEADKAFLRFSQFVSAQRSEEWYQGLMSAIASLRQMPRRCPIARENDKFSKEVRQLMYGKGKSTYRILFTVLDNQNPPIVRILHVRNSSQQAIGESDDLE